MAYKSILSHAAFIDLEKIIDYYHARNPETAKKYYTGILDRIRNLVDFPKQGRIVPEFEDLYLDTYRELIYENYRILYRIEDTTIIVVRIVDSRRLLDMDSV